jgi:hypothetical protein
MKLRKPEMRGRQRQGPIEEYVVWINNVACRCQSLATAEHIARSLKRRGRDIFLCGPMGRATDASDASETSPSIPKQKIGRLLRFPAVSMSTRKGAS